MGCRKLTYWNEVEIPPRRDYEKPATPLRVQPDNEEITVVVVYSIRYNNEKVVQRWLFPDPAEQFHNPYLGIGNNPVMYVDPDGEWVFIAAGFLVGAYIGGAMANDHLNPGKWNFQDANTWIGMGVGGAIGAFGGHALGAAKGKAAFFGKELGSAAAKTAGKKFFGSTVGGMTNSITNYGGADDFGWGTLGDFGAGFGGAYAGINFESKFMGFTVGGSVNTISRGTQAAINGDEFTSWNLAQSFVGGGLSSMVGMSYGLKMKPPVGDKATLKSFGKSFGKYARQSALWDFAYTDQTTFEKRNFGDFATLYGVGGALGASVDMLKFMTPLDGSRRSQVMANKLFKGTLNAATAVTELRMTSQLKGKAGKPKEQPTKLGVLSTKWWFNFTGF